MATVAHCVYCFSVLEHQVCGGKALTLGEASRTVTETKALSAKSHANGIDVQYPLFVTWNTVSSRGAKRLRGCIGTFEPHPLECCLNKAFEDERFQPIREKEFPSLHCEVTLLTDFEKASSPLDWTVGTHGIRISFRVAGRNMGATFLPSVAEEQGWTKKETLNALVRKAGYHKRYTDVDIQLTRYQGSKAELSWDEYINLCK